MLDRKNEKWINIVEAKKHFTQLLRKLKIPVTVTRHGEPVAVILSLEDYKKLTRKFAYHEILELRKALSKSSMTASEAYKLSRKELEERGIRHRH